MKTQHAMKKPKQALKTVCKAIQLMPKNALCKYHKASFLYTLERYEVGWLSFSFSLLCAFLKREQCLDRKRRLVWEL